MAHKFGTHDSVTLRKVKKRNKVCGSVIFSELNLGVNSTSLIKIPLCNSSLRDLDTLPKGECPFKSEWAFMKMFVYPSGKF